MRSLLLCLLVLFLFGSLFAQDNEEFRATWIITWEWTMPSGTIDQQKAKIRGILDNHQKANMNAVLWQVRQGGTAYYPSSFEPWGYYLDHKNPGFDPIAFAIDEAHARGMEFHAWFNVFQTSSTEPGTPAANHPEWICQDQAGIPMSANRALSPGLHPVREYTINVAMEIVNNYDVDGLHLDYVRWNEYSNSSQSLQFAKRAESNRFFDGMITNAQVEDLQTNATGRYLYDVEHPFGAGVPGGFGSWEEWWRWSVTEFVHTLHDSIQIVKPWVRLSPAALGKYNWSGWNGYDVVYQDAALWFNEGYVDQLTPMHYHWFTYDGFYNMLVGPDGNSTSLSCWGAYIQKGIAAGRLFSGGPSASDLQPSPQWKNPIPMVNASRNVSWVDGLQFFSYGQWKNQDYWNTAKEIFYTSKTKIRSAKSDGISPEAPSISLLKIDSLNYQINVTPTASINSNHRFAIYRSTDPILDLDTDQIVDIHFGSDSYSFYDQFSGLQNYNEEFYYFATTLNRYWQESDGSNIIQTDSIPSFAPTIVNSSPTEGDTIAVNALFEVHFSKTIDINTFLTAFSIIPEIQVNQFKWSNNNKSVVISFIGNLEFGTNYSVTLHASLTDLNGVALDGNSDGTPGDSLVINFITKAVDIDGPTILTSNPDFQIKNLDFDIEDVITVLFDEQIKAEMINDTTVILNQGGINLPIKYNLFDVGSKSVLNVQPSEVFLKNMEYVLSLSPFISDTSGNLLGNEMLIPFKTINQNYYAKNIIDDFITVGNWWQPEGSGSTTGIYVPKTTFSNTRSIVYLPASKTPINKYAARLTYEWDPNASAHLLREYLSGGTPRAVEFDTTYILQCYIFGDGSNNKFRFAIDEAVGAVWYNHEVSNWIIIDWIGWKLVEWKLNDPTSVGSWSGLGNEVLDGSKYRIDSFQLTYEPGASISGELFFDNLRIVKKTVVPVLVNDNLINLPAYYELGQNYPNPFNPSTTIPFTVAKSGKVVIEIYDNLGRKVATLINKQLPAGRHTITFDASGFAAGIFYYRMISDGQVLLKKMLFIK